MRKRLLESLGVVVVVLSASGVAEAQIQVVSGTYGANCPDVAQGNVTWFLANECNGKTSCAYTIDYWKIGDAKPGCAKN